MSEYIISDLRKDGKMNFEDFGIEMSQKADKLGIELSYEQIKKFFDYMNMLITWNEKMNLTSIIEEKDIILKHFIDSFSIASYIKDEDKVMDMGTGAGFPGIPLKIIKKDNSFVLVDSLNKRIQFLEEVKKELSLEALELKHARAEELAKNKGYREQMDIITSRAVANLRVLVEYMLPFVKIGGNCICMKGPKVEEEIEEANNAIDILGGKLIKVDHFYLPESDIERNIVIIKKIRTTPSKYPRKAGTPLKQPL